jgi:uncharacterized protein YbjT (DUF2867 family)
MTNTTVLVTGASGTLGGAVVPRLAKQGYDVRPMSRRARPGWVAADLATGAGLAAAMRGVDAIVHLATSATKSRQTDVEGTRRLLAAANAAGVRHIVFISVNGVDRMPFGYYRSKLAAEQIVRAGGVPFMILRAAQFPSLIDAVLTAISKLGPVVVDRSFVLQPVHIDDVADRIADLLVAGPSGNVMEFAGPEVLSLDELARQWLRGAGTQAPGVVGAGAGEGGARGPRSRTDDERAAHRHMHLAGLPAGQVTPVWSGAAARRGGLVVWRSAHLAGQALDHLGARQRAQRRPGDRDLAVPHARTDDHVGCRDHAGVDQHRP